MVDDFDPITEPEGVLDEVGGAAPILPLDDAIVADDDVETGEGDLTDEEGEEEDDDEEVPEDLY